MLFVDSWKESVQDESDGKKELKDIYVGKVEMKDVSDHKYLENLISSDGKNKKNIKAELIKLHKMSIK